jgi:deazaflavin-dependent oxidoreductase (nitroreductase family)
MGEKPDTAMMKSWNTEIEAEFHANDGKVGGPFEGATLVLLTTTGAKSGQQRLSPLVYLTVDGKILVIGSYGGADVDPAWVHNLRANPAAHVELGTESGIEEYDVVTRELPSDERDVVFPQVVAQAPGFGEYQVNTSRVIPMFELVRA